ncbi:MAG: TonB-dependent receptor [Brevundimonas sp.]|nr:MAG: TonB-dependent receptor [Brevundimonas sp.]
MSAPRCRTPNWATSSPWTRAEPWPGPVTRKRGRPPSTASTSAATPRPMRPSSLAGGVLTPRLDYSHISDVWGTIFANEARGDHLEARDIFNAQLTYDRGDGWMVQAYGTNLTDEEYVGAVKSGQRYAGPPRQYGVRLTRTF